jgi:hypothetical protein
MPSLANNPLNTGVSVFGLQEQGGGNALWSYLGGG